MGWAGKEEEGTVKADSFGVLHDQNTEAKH